MIGELRKEAGISQSRLCKGLCSVQLLSKIELEERTPDMLLLEALLQRLGKSPEKLEIILSMEEYRHIEHRDAIEDALRFGKLNEAEEKLNAYLKKYEHEGIMQRMYGYRMRGALAIEQGTYAIAEEWLRKVAVLSVPEQNWLNLKKELLSTFELENFVLLCQAWMKQGKINEAKVQLEVLHEYVNEHITDEEEIIKSQSKIASLLGTIYNKEGRYQDCIKVCEPVFELERDCAVLQAMTLLLQNLSYAYEHIRETEKAKKLLKWKNLLEEVYEQQGFSVHSINGMYFNFYAREYYLDCELIRGERLRKGMTQAELAEGIYECVESLSRVENGKESPNRIKFQQLMERLGVDKSRYNGRLATNSYKVLELDWEIQRHISMRHWEEAKKDLDYLERLVDMSEVQNIQLIHRRRNSLLIQEKKISWQEQLEDAERLLALTYDYQADELTRVPFRNEAYLYGTICVRLGTSERYEEMFAAYKKFIKCYESSGVNVKYHIRSIGTILLDLTYRLEKMGRFAEEEYWAKYHLKQLLTCGKGSAVDEQLANLCCVLVNQNIQKEQAIKYVKQVYHWSELIKYYRYQGLAEKYAKEHFGEIEF